jgi:surface antigen
MKRVLIACAALAALGGVARAAPLCYGPAEIEADQAIRLQIELMVIGETCREPSYRHFLEQNGDALAAYQQILVERFGRERGAAAAEGALQSYLTRLANEAALRAGRTPGFCAEAADLVATAKGMPADGLRLYAAAQAAAARRRYAACGEPAPPLVTAAAAPAVIEPAAARPAVAELAAAGTHEEGLLAVLADAPLARRLDPADRRQIRETTQRTLEAVPSGQPVAWRNPFSRNAGSVVVMRTFRDGGRWCRSFEQSVSVDGETRRGRGTACRRSDGSAWDVVR